MEKQKEKISVRKIGNNYHVVIDNNQFKLVAPNEKTINSLKTKIGIFNKKNTEAKKKEILNIVDTKTKQLEEKKTKAKGIKKVIKKTSKKVKKEDTISPEVNLIEEVKESFKKGDITEDEIRSLQSLLNKVKEEKTKQEEPKKVDSGGSGKERY